MIPTLYLRLAIAAALAAAFAGSLWYAYAKGEKAAEARYFVAMVKQQNELIKAEKANRTIENEMQSQKATLEKQNAENLAKAGEAANRERVAADNLRMRIKQLTAQTTRSGENPGPIAISAPDSRIGNIAGECVAEYQSLAAIARRAYEAGKLCEASYDAVEKINKINMLND